MSDNEDFIKISDWRNTREYQDLRETLDGLKNDIKTLDDRISQVESRNRQNQNTAQLTKKLVDLQLTECMLIVPYVLITNMRTSVHDYSFSCFLWELITVVVCTLWTIEMSKTVVEIYNLYNAFFMKDPVKYRKRIREFSFELGSWKLHSKWSNGTDVETSSIYSSDDDSDSTYEAESELFSDNDPNAGHPPEAVDSAPSEDLSDFKDAETTELPSSDGSGHLPSLHENDLFAPEE